MADNKKTLDVAVIGGGIGGLCLSLGLLKHPHLRVQIYEAAHEFSEIGAGVAFGPNAQRALRLLGSDLEDAYLQLCTHNGSPEMKNVWFEFLFGAGPHAGETITDVTNEIGQSSLHRAKFLDRFVKLVPKEICHFGKRLDRVEDKPGSPVNLHFKDGTTASADVVIGADGVHSVVREHLLGADNPKLLPVFTNCVAYRGLIPMDEAVAAVGDRFARNSFNFVGPGAAINIYPVDFGKKMNIVAIDCSCPEWDGAWVQPASYSKIAAVFSEWNETCRSITKLLDRPETMAWSLWQHQPAPTYCGGRVAMMGDAAHASTPFQGQGATQAIEDALVLSNLLGAIEDPSTIEPLLQAYDQVRRARSQKVVTTSREAVELMSMRAPGVMGDAAALKKAWDERLRWMWDHDLEADSELALKIYRDKLTG